MSPLKNVWRISGLFDFAETKYEDAAYKPRETETAVVSTARCKIMNVYVSYYFGFTAGQSFNFISRCHWFITQS